MIPFQKKLRNSDFTYFRIWPTTHRTQAYSHNTHNLFIYTDTRVCTVNPVMV